MRNAWICISVWLWPVVCAGAQAPPSPYAAVTGIVLDDASGNPIRRAVVTLSTLAEPHLEAVTFSESNGAFGFTRIPPGKYQLRAEMEGFQAASFGASTPNRPPGTLKLAAGDVRFGITFRLRRLGSISGVVLDTDGDPVPGVLVRLFRSGWERLKPAWKEEHQASTDDRGRYHIADIDPGRYIVMATRFRRPFVTQSEATTGQAASQKSFAPQFYPDSSRMSDVDPLQVAPGQELDAIDFHLAAAPVAPIHGRAVVPPDLPAETNVMVTVFPREPSNGSGPSFAAAAFPPNYAFEINELIAGPYVLVASVTTADRDYSAVERIELPPGGQELSLHMQPAIDLAGRVDLEGGGWPSGPLRVTLAPGDFPPGRKRIETAVKPDGTFVVPNVVPGIWDIDVGPLPSGGYIKAMRLGDEDVLTGDMTVQPDTHGPLRIVASTRGAVVSGTVTVPPGVARSPRASVLLAPYGKYANVLSFYALAFADDAGHFEFKGVTPGRYKLFAFEEMDPSAYHDPGFLKPYEQTGDAFEVREGGRLERQTRLIPAGGQVAASR